MTREYTTKILELLNEGDYSMECLLPDLLNWMSEDDVREFVVNHDYLSTLIVTEEDEDEDEEFDNSGIDFITGILGKPSKSGLGLCWSGLANNGNTVTLFVPENDSLSLDDYIEFRDPTKSLGLPTDDWGIGFLLVKDVLSHLKRVK